MSLIQGVLSKYFNTQYTAVVGGGVEINIPSGDNLNVVTVALSEVTPLFLTRRQTGDFKPPFNSLLEIGLVLVCPSNV